MAGRRACPVLRPRLVAAPRPALWPWPPRPLWPRPPIRPSPPVSRRLCLSPPIWAAPRRSCRGQGSASSASAASAALSHGSTSASSSPHASPCARSSWPCAWRRSPDSSRQRDMAKLHQSRLSHSTRTAGTAAKRLQVALAEVGDGAENPAFEPDDVRKSTRSRAALAIRRDE